MRASFKRLAVGTMLAGAAGYLAGILTAPKSGKDTRADIKDVADSKITEAEKQLKRAHTELNGLLNQAKDQGSKARGKAKVEYEDVADKAGIAKQKVREIISAIHEGDTDNKELQKALTESQKAIKHLKAYLKK